MKNTTPLLKRGDSGLEVKRVQNILLSQGHFKGVPGGTFGPTTHQAVIYFQQTHQGPDGKMLVVDGEVGPATWWALENPSGPAQKSNIDVAKISVKSGLTPMRQKVVDLALKEHRAGVREIPDGSNSGDGVDKYLKGFGPAYWCMLFVSWVRREAGFPLLAKDQHAHCLTVWNLAKAAGYAFPKERYKPIPGDIFIMLYRDPRSRHLTGSGHTGIVTAVDENSWSFNSAEGNAGNRVKQTLRQVKQHDLVGFINDYPKHEQPTQFKRGVVAGTAELATR